jgi:hypothetical protein
MVQAAPTRTQIRHTRSVLSLGKCQLTGIVGVTWLDRRNDPSNVSYEEFCTYSRGAIRCNQNVTERAEIGRMGPYRPGTGIAENPYCIGLFSSYAERPGPL